MSTEDDRPTGSGGSTDSGYYRPSQHGFGSAGSGHDTAAFDTFGQATTTDLAAFDEADRPAREPLNWHVGADLATFVLRVAVGALFVGHGLQKVFGLLGGPGIGGFADYLGMLGFQQTTVLAWVTGLTELVGGVLLIVGLFTPAAAAGVLGVVANAIWVKLDVTRFAGSVELEVVYAAAAFALLFTGAGRFSLDRNTPWFRKAPAFGFVFLLLAIGLSVVTLVVLR